MKTFGGIVLFAIAMTYLAVEGVNTQLSATKGQEEAFIYDYIIASHLHHCRLTQPIIFTSQEMSASRLLKLLSEAGHQVVISQHFSAELLMFLVQRNHRPFSAIVVGNKNQIINVFEAALSHNLLQDTGTLILMCNVDDNLEEFPKIALAKDIRSCVIYVPFSEVTKSKKSATLYEIRFSYKLANFVANVKGIWSVAGGLQIPVHNALQRRANFENATINVLSNSDNRGIYDHWLSCSSDGKEDCRGYYVDVMVVLRERLNFSMNWRDTPWFDSFLEEFITNSWDLGIAGITMTINRTRQYAFTSPINNEEIVIAIRQPSFVSNIGWLSWLWNPLDKFVWVTAVVALFVLGTAHATVDKALRSASPNETSFNPAFCAFVQQSPDGKSVVHRGLAFKVIIFTSYACFWLLFVVYSAVQTSCLTLENSYSTVSSFEELAFNTTLHIARIEGTYIEEYMKTSKDRAYQEVGRRMDMLVGELETTELFCNEKCAMLMSKRRAMKMSLVVPHCSPYFVPENNIPKEVHFVAQKNSTIAKHVSHVITRMHESGITHRLQLKHGLKDAYRKTPEKPSGIPISVQHVIWPLVILATGNFMAIAALVVERAWFVAK